MRVLYKKAYLAFIFVSFIGLNSLSQAYTSRSYGPAEGFPNLFVYGINQDIDGYLWVGTGEGLLRYNGQNFLPVFQGDSLAENFISAVFKSNNGNIWYGHQNGGITIQTEDGYKILKNRTIPKGSVIKFREAPNGDIWFCVQGKGLVRYFENGKLAAFEAEFRDKFIRDFVFINDKELLVATTEGLLKYTFNDFGFPMHKKQDVWLENKEVSSLLFFNRALYCGTSDGIFLSPVLEGSSLNFTPVANAFLSNTDVRNLFIDNEKNIWAGTWGNGLYKIIYGNKSETKYNTVIPFAPTGQLTSKNINCIFQDREGTIWIGTHGNGLVKLSDKILEYRDLSHLTGNENIYTVRNFNRNTYYGSFGCILVHNKKYDELKVLNQEQGLPADAVTSIYVDRKGVLWAGTQNSGTYYKKTEDEKFTNLSLEEDLLTKSVNDITGSDQFIWIATKFGLFKWNTITNSYFVYSTENELRHNDINAIYKDTSSNDIWLATQSNYLTKIRGKEITDYKILEGDDALKITGIQLDENGEPWISTYGDGIYHMQGDKFIHYSRVEGLLSDYCYGLKHDNEGNAWITHRGGISRLKKSTGQIKVFSVKDGFVGDCHINAIDFEDDNGLLFGTDKGVVKYYAGRDLVNTIPPKIDLINIIVSADNEDQIFETDDISLSAGAYRIKFQFIGLSFKNTENITYKYHLSGYDLDTNVSNVNYAQYNRLEEGNYTFTCIACNSDGFCSEEYISVNIYIATPFYKRTWFLAGSSFLLIALVFGVVRYREQQQKRTKMMLQRELDKRTKEVVEQRDELERKNKDITDSINYAKRIQSAIMPVDSKLQSLLPDSFLYFKPRDIVSGDFYWVNRYDNRVVVACADCTGHGVPGAFMSIIGSTILQDSLTRPEVSTPSDLLYRLDNELQKLLSSEKGFDKPRDGMDISVCEIHLDTKNIRLASAMRPVIIFKNGEEVQWKGSRFPIGGGYTENKDFSMYEIQLNKGDIIYMFSDGYADQFGGTEGKKLKLSRMREMFAFMHGKDAAFQYATLDSQLKKWMMDQHQVDDILVMGLRIP